VGTVNTNFLIRQNVSILASFGLDFFYMDSRDDATLITATRAGDKAAFGLLYDRYVDRIYRFVFYKTFQKEVTEDIVSDVFHKVYDRLGSFDSTRGTFSQWVYRIARNAVIDHYRTLKKTIPIEDAFDLGEEDRTVEEHDNLLALGRVREFMKALSPRQREIITLRIWEELSYKEIADQLDTTEDAAKMAFSRAMKELREKCGRLGLTILTVLIAHDSLPFPPLS
jgi:RNA polymerase sigma-70 factor (ECF subfamily)